MWNIVASIQQTLDEAAGLNERPSDAHVIDVNNDVLDLVHHHPQDDTSDGGEISPRTTSQPVAVADLKESSIDASDEAGGVTQSLVHLEHDSNTNDVPPSPQPSTRCERSSDIGEFSQREQQLVHLAQSLQQRLEQWKPIVGTVEALKSEGASLSRALGAERERAKQALHERKALAAKLDAANELIHAHASKEKHWADAQASFRESESSLKQRVATLEAAMVRQADDLRRLSEANAETDERYRDALAQLQREQEAHRALQERDESTFHAQVELLQEELLQARQAHRQAMVESEQQFAAVQRDLSSTEARAHAAESKLLDSSCTAAAGMQDLVLQCERMAATISALQQQLASKQEHIATLIHSQKAIEATAAETSSRLEDRAKKLAAERKALMDDHERTVAALAKAHAHNEELSRLNDGLQSSLAMYKHELEVAERNRAQKEEDSLKLTAITGNDARRGGVAANPPLTDGEGTKHDDVSQTPPAPSGLQRMEREVARLTKEVRRLKLVEQSAARYKAQLDELLPQHDVLLQMYGMLEEQLHDARADAQQVKSVFQHQLDMMGRELEGRLSPKDAKH